jgi:hypothetical protein
MSALSLDPSKRRHGLSRNKHGDRPKGFAASGRSPGCLSLQRCYFCTTVALLPLPFTRMTELFGGKFSMSVGTGLS